MNRIKRNPFKKALIVTLALACVSLVGSCGMIPKKDMDRFQKEADSALKKEQEKTEKEVKKESEVAAEKLKKQAEEKAKEYQNK